ncbi:MAG TPA: YCF48-related protein [Bryobacteraceae bacterium]
MQLLATLLLAAAVLCAQELQRLPMVCSEDDVQALGLTCSEDDSCPVFLELQAVEASGPSVYITGNLHTVNVTVSGVLLESDDGGKTWTEPAKRLRSASLEQIQFVDFQHGWAAGVMLEPLPKNPFLLLTTDGGKSWRKAPLSEDADFGSIQKFWFESPTSGELVLDRSQGGIKRYELYQSMTGGASWELRQKSDHAIALSAARAPESGNWRLRPDGEAYRVERRTTQGWETAARFAIRAGDCK